MTTLPADGYMENASRIVAEMKAVLDDLRDVIAELPGGDDDFSTNEQLTISSGSVTATRAAHSIETEGAASSDDLDNIDYTNHPEGRQLLIRAADSAHTVVVKDQSGGAGEILTADGNDFYMNDTDMWLLLVRVGTQWIEVNRNFGANMSMYRTYLGLGSAAVEDAGTAANECLQLNGSGYVPAGNLDISERGEYILIQDQKSSGTNGGTLTSGSWQKRDLTTEVVDEGSNAALASSQITLGAGTYYCRISCPASDVDSHQARLHETTGTISDVLGTTESCSDPTDMTRSFIVGKFTVTSGHVGAGQNVFEVQHRCQTTQSLVGCGVYCGWGTEVYTIAEFWKVD